MKDLLKIVESLNNSRLNNGGKAVVYFIGIGGIGMSALARYFNSKGVMVSGYDKTATILTEQLRKEGIGVHYEDDPELINKDTQLVIYTPAVPSDHKELNYYKQNNYTVVKRSDVLGAITKSSFNICVAGTHGKTTTSTMIAHILRHSGYGCNAFLGGIAANYNTNFWSSENHVCVVEADEYDRSFLKLSPDVAIITAMDADHLDIYGTADAVEQAFIDFSSKVKPGGLLISKLGLKRSDELQATKQLKYSVQNNKADAFAGNIKMNNGSYEFDVVISDKVLENVVLKMGGMHNIENVVAAITVANHLKIDDDKIKAAVSSFKGVKRRFEYIIPPSSKREEAGGEVIFIDDYAHHPQELKALISGAKALFNNRKCTVVFQPHLYTRTRDFANEFAASLDLADEIILLPVYPARELPIEGVNSEMILSKMKNENKKIMNKEELLNHFGLHKVSLLGGDLEGAVLITAGAGDIDTLIEPLKQIIQHP